MEFSLLAYLDIEEIIRQTGIEIQEARFGDTAVLESCWSSGILPAYRPQYLECPDVTGVSGRRITLAHEFCHLLFDRAGLRSLARFEGGGADSDRLIEMRANAFAVELLVPMATLVGIPVPSLRKIGSKKSRSISRSAPCTSMAREKPAKSAVGAALIRGCWCSVPGLSVAVVNEGRIEWARGYGVLEAGGKRPSPRRPSSRPGPSASPSLRLRGGRGY